MERRWILSAVAALAVSAPALADDRAPDAAPEAPAPVVSTTPEPAAEPAEPAAETPLTQVAQATPAPAPAAAAEEEEKAPKFTFGGQTDFYFTSNLNNPYDGRNGLRAWDIKDEHGPHLGLIELWGEYARDPIGARIDLNFGPTARLNGSTEQSDQDWLQYFQQAYVSANLNKEGTTWIDFGKYVTPIGAEVIEPAGNWFYSQGVMFTWPIPFWHFGARVTHKLNDTDWLLFHVNQGWGTVVQPAGAGPNFGITGSKVLSPQWTATASYLGGDNFAGINDPAWRHLFNSVLAYKPSENSKLSYLFDLTLGFQTDFANSPGDDETASWYGIQAQAKYAFKPDQYTAARFEYLHDGSGALFGDDLDVLTLSLNYTKVFNKNFQARAEYRHDIAGGGEPFSASRRGTTTSDQGTFILGAIVTY
ncbi:MAG: outer membrane beta-barrel protein [Actinomycetota bacterium]